MNPAPRLHKNGWPYIVNRPATGSTERINTAEERRVFICRRLRRSLRWPAIADLSSQFSLWRGGRLHWLPQYFFWTQWRAFAFVLYFYRKGRLRCLGGPR